MSKRTFSILLSVVILFLIGTYIHATTYTINQAVDIKGTMTASSISASQAVFTDGSKNLVSNAISGSGNVCMSTSCSMTSPILGTPTSGTLTNTTGLPFSALVTGTNSAADAICASGCTIEPSTGIVSTNANFPNTGVSAPTSLVPATGWTVRGAANATYNDFLGNDLVFHATSAGNNQTALTRTVSVPYTIIAFLSPQEGQTGNNSFINGITVTDASKYETIGAYWNSTTNVNIAVFTQSNLTTALGTGSSGTNVAGPTASVTGPTIGIKIVNNSTNRVWSYWGNGAWHQMLSEASGTFLTETAAGPFLQNGGVTIEAHLKYWSVQ